MLSGVVMIFQGFSYSLIAPLPGIIPIILGHLLFNSGDKAKRLYIKKYEEHQIDDMEELLKNYGWYLLVVCILTIIVILFYSLVYLYFATR